MTHPLSISDKHLHLYLQKTKNRHSFLFRLFSCAKLNIQMIQSHITTQLDLVQNTLNGSFLFYLLAYKSPQEILRSLVLFSRSNIYQFVNQFGNMAFMLVYMLEHIQRRSSFLRNSIHSPHLGLSATFHHILRQHISMITLLMSLRFHP